MSEPQAKVYKTASYTRKANQKWASKNRDKMREYARDYYQRNKDTINAKRREKRAKARLAANRK